MKQRLPSGQRRILLVDDDADLLLLISMRLKSKGYEVASVNSGAKALAQLPVIRPHVVVTDQRMPGMDGLALFEAIQKRQPQLPVIVLTAHGTIPDAVEATRRGIFSYLVKPFDANILLDNIDKAMQQGMYHQSADTPSQVDESWREEILSKSAAMESLLQQAHATAVTDVSILIQSQTGTGKELLARAIHKASPRAAEPFVAFNCAAIPESLIESELFGHAAGAFTGATRAHAGLFMAANKGTVFLDEIGDMPMAAQAQLLRVLERQEVRPVGTTDNLPINVRIIAATHHDLAEKVQQGSFREDLYYRLNVITLEFSGTPLARRVRALERELATSRVEGDAATLYGMQATAGGAPLAAASPASQRCGRKVCGSPKACGSVAGGRLRMHTSERAGIRVPNSSVSRKAVNMLSGATGFRRSASSTMPSISGNWRVLSKSCNTTAPACPPVCAPSASMASARAARTVRSASARASSRRFSNSACAALALACISLRWLYQRANRPGMIPSFS